jgi:hypothetical protein
MRRWLLAIALIGACEAEPRPRTADGPTGKLELFGDPSLVPTREGERIRRELAIAGELEQALLELGLATAHVDVELREPAAVVVIARAGSEPGPTQTEIANLVHALVELEPTNLQLHVLPAKLEPPVPERRFDGWTVALLLTALGLGGCLGILGERLRPRA